MTACDMQNAVMHLIQMCTDGLIFLAHGNSLLNQTHRTYITSVLPCHMFELCKKVSGFLLALWRQYFFPE